MGANAEVDDFLSSLCDWRVHHCFENLGLRDLGRLQWKRPDDFYDAHVAIEACSNHHH